MEQPIQFTRQSTWGPSHTLRTGSRRTLEDAPPKSLPHTVRAPLLLFKDPEAKRHLLRHRTPLVFRLQDDVFGRHVDVVHELEVLDEVVQTAAVEHDDRGAVDGEFHHEQCALGAGFFPCLSRSAEFVNDGVGGRELDADYAGHVCLEDGEVEIVVFDGGICWDGEVDMVVCGGGICWGEEQFFHLRGLGFSGLEISS